MPRCARQLLAPAQLQRLALMAVENLVAAVAGMGVGSLEVLGGFFRFADMGVEQAQMIIERFAPVAFALDQPRVQSDLVDDRLIAGAIAALLLSPPTPRQ